jgi:predicted CopG family antitoxin
MHSLFRVFINMKQKNRKTIMITEDTYETLKNLGTVTESFNDVIWRLIQKAVSGQQPLDESAGR